MLSREEILPFESFFISKKDYLNKVVVVTDYSEYTDFVQYPGNNKKTKVNKLVFLTEGGATVTTTSSVIHKQRLKQSLAISTCQLSLGSRKEEGA